MIKTPYQTQYTVAKTSRKRKQQDEKPKYQIKEIPYLW